MSASLVQIATDIYQVCLPLPFALRIVNCYLVKSDGGWTIVDTGIHTPEGEAVWRGVFRELRIRMKDIEQILLTHVHPDHFGMAGWLQESAIAVGHHIPIRTSAREDEQTQKVWRNPFYDGAFGGWLQQNGMPQQMAQVTEQHMGDTHTMTLPHPTPLEHLAYDSLLLVGEREFRVIHAPGHSDGQVLFYDEFDELIICGDHVLNQITPNIGVWPHTDPDPLGQFMNSLEMLKTLTVDLALPGHKTFITEWQGRIDELLEHHRQRLVHVLTALEADAHTPYEVSLKLFEAERFTPHEWRFALAETLAHLEYLRLREKVRLNDNEQGKWFELVK